MSTSTNMIREDLALYGKMMTASGTGYVAGQVEVTSVCGQRCKACASWREHVSGAQVGEWTFTEMQTLTRALNLHHPNFEHLSLTGGDPLRWPPLWDFLKWWIDQHFSFSLQLTTPFVCTGNFTPCSYYLELIRRGFRDVRVSLDASNAELYHVMRGVRGDPKEILADLRELKHPRLAIMTCLGKANREDLPALIRLVGEELVRKGARVRKVMVLPALDQEGGEGGEGESERAEIEKAFREAEEVARGEGIKFDCVRPLQWEKGQGWERDKEGQVTRCWSGKICFHIKANKDFYPCCLVGGEAVRTRKDCRAFLGEAKEWWGGQGTQGNADAVGRMMQRIRENYIPFPYYSQTGSLCRSLCQAKQFQVNRAGERAAGTRLAMP